VHVTAVFPAGNLDPPRLHVTAVSSWQLGLTLHLVRLPHITATFAKVQGNKVSSAVDLLAFAFTELDALVRYWLSTPLLHSSHEVGNPVGEMWLYTIVHLRCG
jgi:hypothetical protein